MKDQKKTDGRILYRTCCCVFIVVVVLVLLLMVPSQAAAQEKPLVAGDYRLFYYPYGDEGNSSGNMTDPLQTGRVGTKPHVTTSKFIYEICLGALGNVVAGYGGAALGYMVSKEGDGEMFDGIGGTLLGYSIGSAFGSAFGVYLIGNSRDVRGSFGSALLGSLVGEGAAILLTALTRNGTVALISLIALPPIGAAVFFNSSLRYKSPPVSRALLNFNKGDFKFGIPLVRIQPLPRFSKQQKLEVKISVNLLNIAL
jgi:hypothetical protein